VWRKPLWQRITIAVVAIGLDVGMIALIATGSAGTWQPWFFLLVFTLGLAGWELPKTVLDDGSVTSRSILGLTRSIALPQITNVGYGPLGVWIEGIDPSLILHAVQGIRPLGGVGTNQQGGPSGQEAAELIRSRAAVAGAQLTAASELPGTPPNAASLWSRLR
jgi:hypothetical protein